MEGAVTFANFSNALYWLKEGHRVARKGWNSEGMFLYLEKFEHSNKFNEKGYEYEPCIVMFTAQGKWQPGWLASQADLLAEDWEIVS